MSSQVLEISNQRVLNKLNKLEKAQEVIKFYNQKLNTFSFNHKPNTLSLKEVMGIRKSQLIHNHNFKTKTPPFQKTFSNFQEQLDKFKNKLSLCGNFITTNYYCKQCEAVGENESLLAVKKEIHTCGIRYCSKVNCILQRFSDTINSLKSIKRFKGLRTLHHFSIGFPKVSEKDFNENFDKIKKKQEYVLNKLFRKLRSKKIFVNGYKVLDISKGENKGDWDHQYFMHYHFIAIPFSRKDVSAITLSIKEVEKKLNKRKQKETPSFHYQSFGLKDKDCLFAYVSLRAIGCYKKYEGFKPNYNINEEKKLRNSLEQGKFMYLDELITPEQYLRFFFNKRHLSKVGDLPPFRYSSIIADNSVSLDCIRHGKLPVNDRKLIRIEIFIDPNPPPPNFSKQKHQIGKFIPVPQPIGAKNIPLNFPIKNFETQGNDLILRSGKTIGEFKRNDKRIMRGTENIKLTSDDYLNLGVFGKC